MCSLRPQNKPHEESENRPDRWAASSGHRHGCAKQTRQSGQRAAQWRQSPGPAGGSRAPGTGAARRCWRNLAPVGSGDCLLMGQQTGNHFWVVIWPKQRKQKGPNPASRPDPSRDPARAQSRSAGMGARCSQHEWRMPRGTAPRRTLVVWHLLDRGSGLEAHAWIWEAVQLL